MAKDMYQKRQERQNKPKKIDNKTNINWYPGHMAKTKRLIKENLDKIDVIYEVVDARIPYSTTIRDLDDTISNKPRIIVFSKYDLCDKKETNKWKKFYEDNGEHVICIDNTCDLKPIIIKTKELMYDFNVKRIEKGMSIRKSRVLVIGVPNSGKSTLINRLASKKVVDVGNKPGITKELSWIRVNDEVELLDTPGILWPKIDEGNIAYNLACFTAIKEEILPIYDVIEYFLRTLEKYYPNKLKDRFKIESVDEDIINTLDSIGKKRGALIRGGDIDYDKVIQIVLSDIKDAKITNITFDRFDGYE